MKYPGTTPSRRPGPARKSSGHAIDVLAQCPVVDGLVSLHVKRVGQRQLVQLAGDRGERGNGNASPKREVHVRVGLGIALCPRAEDPRFRHFGVAAQNVPNQFLLGAGQAKGVHDAPFPTRSSRQAFS